MWRRREETSRRGRMLLFMLRKKKDEARHKQKGDSLNSRGTVSNNTWTRKKKNPHSERTSRGTVAGGKL